MPSNSDKRVIGYAVVKVSGVGKLAAAVNEKIKEDWITQGGIQTIVTSVFTLTEICYQAMGKH